MTRRENAALNHRKLPKKIKNPRRRTVCRVDPAAARLDLFPPVMPLGQFLFEYLYRCGVRHGFEPGQRQGQSGTAEEGSPVEMPGGLGHGSIPYAALIHQLLALSQKKTDPFFLAES